jgi:hypothetical protein
MQKQVIDSVKTLISAYHTGTLGDTTMPEDTHPTFSTLEQKRIFYTLPMALNYQRNSFKLWEAATVCYNDKETQDVFNLQRVNEITTEELRNKLTKHKVALQPNKHIDTWQRISETIYTNWESISDLFIATNQDYLELREVIQKEYKKGFPYLSGPKIFNYWMYIMSEYGEVAIRNRSHIEIAPDTHVIQASIKLGVITKEESESLKREDISKLWRELLDGTSVDPIDVHSPLWFWSRSGFEFKLEEK